MTTAIGDGGRGNAASRKRPKSRANQAVLSAASGRRTTGGPSGDCDTQ
jgi:hypothetical protein